MELTITTRKTINIDESKLQIYAEETRKRFGMEKDKPVNMVDLLYQAYLDDDIVLPEEFDLEEYDDDLSPEEIAELAAG